MIVENVTRETVWIVDYDLPADSNRRQFYRAIRRYREEHKIMSEDPWSTRSVIITADKDFAAYVFEMAAHVGHARANLYKAKQIKGNNHRDLTGE